nr:hypothetical protein Itr_chr02CG07760 [Ipomoea trifida]
MGATPGDGGAFRRWGRRRLGAFRRWGLRRVPRNTLRASGRLLSVTCDSKKHVANKLASFQGRRRRSMRAGPDELHLQGRRRRPLRTGLGELHLQGRRRRPLRAGPGELHLQGRCRYPLRHLRP